MNHRNPALLLASLAASSSPVAGQSLDRLLVSGFSSASVVRYDAESGAVADQLGPAPLAGVLGATVGPDGLLYVCSESNNRVLRFDPVSGAFVDAFIENDPATPQDETGGLQGPAGIVFGPRCQAYVASFNSDAVLRYDGSTGAFIDVFVQPGDGNLDGPDVGLTFGTDGDLFVPSFWNNRVKRYDRATGAFVENFVRPSDSGLSRPRTIRFPGDGFCYVTSEGDDRLIRCDAVTGDFVADVIADDPGTPGDETGGLDGPTGFDWGPDGRLYVASLGTDSVLRYEPDGTFVDVFVASGAGGLDAPTFLLFRPQAWNGCAPAPNSFGDGARLGVEGFSSIGADRFELVARCAPRGQVGIFFYGTPINPTPWGDGFRCVGNVFRLAVAAVDTFGRAAHALDFANPPDPAGTIIPGSSWSFQFWFRDPGGPGGTGFNYSDRVTVDFAR